jgi:hypothetical protein
MEAKEKAEQLVNKMFNWIEGGSAIEYEIAKECALIAVDEILDSIVIIDLTAAENQFTYWQEVKKEIENL